MMSVVAVCGIVDPRTEIGVCFVLSTRIGSDIEIRCIACMDGRIEEFERGSFFIRLRITVYVCFVEIHGKCLIFFVLPSSCLCDMIRWEVYDYSRTEMMSRYYRCSQLTLTYLHIYICDF